MLRPITMVLLLAGIALAGCGAKDSTETSVEVHTRPALAADKGAVTGLVIDDRYRPVPGALVLLTPGGLTATSDSEGQFAFDGLEPGGYVARVQAKDHEGAPKNLDVRAGEYTELEILARRVFSEGSTIVTLQYALFTPCAESVILVSTVNDLCYPDQSGDSYRPGLQGMDFTAYGKNITYMIGEIALNQPDNYVFVLRCDDGSSFGCGEYGQYPTNGTAYAKVTLQYGAMFMQQYDTGVNWTNEGQMAALLFFYGTGGNEISYTAGAKAVGCTVTDTWNNNVPVPFPANPLNNKPLLCRYFYGAGHKFAIEGRIILSLFIGPPDVDIPTYGVLAPKP